MSDDERDSEMSIDSSNVPAIGSRWIWEPNKPWARCSVTVTEVKWNGEEWWVRTIPTGNMDGRDVWGDLMRFREACVPDRSRT